MRKTYYIERLFKYPLFKVLSIVLLLLFSYQAIAQTTISNPEIKARISIDTNVLLVGQQTQLHLAIEVPEDIRIHWPDFMDTITKDIEIIKSSSIDTLPTDNKGFIKLQQNITIASYDSGFYAIPPFIFKYAKKEDSKSTQIHIKETNALLLEVQNVRVDLKKEIKDIKPVIEEPWTFGEILPYLLGLLGLFIIIAIGIFIYQRRKQNMPIFALPKKPKIPAHIIALQKLDKLKDKKLWQSGNNKDFYSELTDIIREYMESQLDFGALEMITDDIIQKLQKQDLIETLFLETQNVLTTADLVKFAKVEPLADENNRALKWAYAFVESTKPKDEQTNLSKEESKSKVEPLKTIDQ